MASQEQAITGLEREVDFYGLLNLPTTATAE